MDVSKPYEDTITNKSPYAQFTPYELYLKFLYEYFRNELNRPCGRRSQVKYELTKHAEKVLAEREIAAEWMERRFRRIPEFGGRVLRVAVNTTVEPNRIVSVFFDRKMKGKL